MPSCTWTKKRKNVVVGECHLEQQPGSAFCPRHTFLWNVAQKEEYDKDQATRALKEHAAHGRTPRTRLQHCAAGYVFKGSSQCTCGERIEWWFTPNRKDAPYNPMPEETSIAVSHFVTCTRRSQFRRAS